MKELKERVSYLQGLADGLNVGNDTKEGRLLSEVIDVLGDFAEYLGELEDAQIDLEEYVESIDEDLYDLEDEVLEIEDDEDELDEVVDFDDDDLTYVDVECPKCHEIVCFEADIVDDEDLIEVTCPNCDEVVFVNDMEEIDDDAEVTPVSLRSRRDRD